MNSNLPLTPFGESIVEYPAFQQAYETLTHFYENTSKKPRAVLLVAPPGAGKTFLADLFVKDHPPEDSDEMTRVPVVYVEVPPENTLTGLLGDILKTIGDPLPDSCKIRQRRDRIIKQFKQQNIRLLIIDECQDLEPKSGGDAKSKNIRFLKYIMNATKVPVILTGTLEAKSLLSADAQLRGRIKEVVELSYFNCLNQDNALDFADYLDGVLQSYPRKVEGFSFTQVDAEGDLKLKDNINNLIRLNLATDGCQRLIHDLLERLLRFTDDDEVITQHHFAEYWHLGGLLEEKLEFNPFNSEISLEKVRKEAEHRGLYDRDKF